MNSKQAHLAHRSKKKISPAEFPMKMKRNVKTGHFLLKVKNCFQSLHTPKGTCTIAGIAKITATQVQTSAANVHRPPRPTECLYLEQSCSPRGKPSTHRWMSLLLALPPANEPDGGTSRRSSARLPASATARTPGPEGAAAAPRPEQGSFRQATSRLVALSQTAVLLPGCTLHSVEKLGWGWGERS